MRRIGRTGMRVATLALALGAPGAGVAAAGWTPLGGEEIAAALAGRTLGFADGTRQIFRKGGKTTREGRASATGSWKVEGSKLCQQWKPQGRWDCAGVERHERGQRLRLPGPGGALTEALYLDVR